MGNMERVLRLMAEKNASDVFISANAPVMIKINGNMVAVNPQRMTADTCLVLLKEVLSEEQIGELMQFGEMNTSFALQGVGNYRISVLRQRGTYAAVIRYIPIAIPALDTLGLPTETLIELVMRQRGLILMVGATGSGKSTSLAAMLDHRNQHRSSHMLTIEDPIEFVFDNKRSIINQREVGTDTADRQVALKNAMRQAPDVILVGEIRDRETMSAALAYAQSGHLCLATLHASNSYQTLNRILTFYPEEVRETLLGDLASGLAAIVSQRLLRTVDGKRVPACEILLNSKLVSELIEKGDILGVKDAMSKSMSEGSQTFEEDIARLIQNEVVSREEGLMHADSPTNLMWRLQNTSAEGAHSSVADVQDDSAEPQFSEITLDMGDDD
ncbi:MAG: PilT/PilU family type 4a pilus ATPase [Brachymonas sp.]|nr:PilT/PilU family type 4a pilus ATPase [Brachymonas sp.]